MKTTHSIQFIARRFTCACALILIAGTISLRAQEHGRPATTVQPPETPAARNAVSPKKLPRLPAGVEELKFGDFFVAPVGHVDSNSSSATAWAWTNRGRFSVTFRRIS